MLTLISGVFCLFSDKSFLQQYPELQKALDDELMRVTRQYGAEKPEDLAKLPAAKVERKSNYVCWGVLMPCCTLLESEKITTEGGMGWRVVKIY